MNIKNSHSIFDITDNFDMAAVKVKKVSKFRWVPLYIFFIISILSFYIGQHISPVTSLAEQVIDVKIDDYNRTYFTERGKKVYPQFIEVTESVLLAGQHSDTDRVEFVFDKTGTETIYKKLSII